MLLLNLLCLSLVDVTLASDDGTSSKAHKFQLRFFQNLTWLYSSQIECPLSPTYNLSCLNMRKKAFSLLTLLSLEKSILQYPTEYCYWSFLTNINHSYLNKRLIDCFKHFTGLNINVILLHFYEQNILTLPWLPFWRAPY